MSIIERALPKQQPRSYEVRNPGGGMESLIPKKMRGGSGGVMGSLIPKKRLTIQKKIKKRRYRDISSSRPRRMLSSGDSDDKLLNRDRHRMKSHRRRSFESKKRRHHRHKRSRSNHRDSRSKSKDRPRRTIPSDDSDNELLIVGGDLRKMKPPKRSSQSVERKKRTKPVIPSGSDESSDDSPILNKSRLNISRLEPKNLPKRLLISESSDDDIILPNKLTPKKLNDEKSLSATKTARIVSGDEPIRNGKAAARTGVPSGSESDDEPVAKLISREPVDKETIEQEPAVSLKKINQSESDNASVSVASIRNPMKEVSQAERDEERVPKLVQEDTQKPAESLRNIDKLERETAWIKNNDDPITITPGEELKKPEPSPTDSEVSCKSKSISESVTVAQSDSESDEPICIKSKSKKGSRLLVETNNDDKPTSLSVKVESEDSDDEPICISTKSKQKRVKPTKKGPKKKKSSKSSKPKKVYDLPGQKKDTPNELNGARIFYETLYEQLPESKMAEEWLLKFGLFPHDKAAAIVKAQLEAKGKSSSSIRVKKKANTVKTSTKTPKIMEIPSGDSSSDEGIIMRKKKVLPGKASSEEAKSIYGKASSEEISITSKTNEIFSVESSSDEGIVMRKKKQMPSGRASSEEWSIATNKTEIPSVRASSEEMFMTKKRGIPSGESSSDEGIVMRKRKDRTKYTQFG